MSTVTKRTVSLPADQAAYVDARVASGDYASASEVVREGLRALKARDAAIDRWLNEAVAPAHDAMAADPNRSVSSEAVRADLAARHAKRMKRPL